MWARLNFYFGVFITHYIYTSVIDDEKCILCGHESQKIKPLF